MFNIGDTVKVKNPDNEIKDDLLSAEALDILTNLDFTGKVTQIQDGLHYVGFINEDGWITQVFKEEEIERVE